MTFQDRWQKVRRATRLLGFISGAALLLALGLLLIIIGPRLGWNVQRELESADGVN